MGCQLSLLLHVVAGIEAPWATLEPPVMGIQSLMNQSPAIIGFQKLNWHCSQWYETSLKNPICRKMTSSSWILENGNLQTDWVQFVEYKFVEYWN